jgi:hypothetical protein
MERLSDNLVTGLVNGIAAHGITILISQSMYVPPNDPHGALREGIKVSLKGKGIHASGCGRDLNQAFHEAIKEWDATVQEQLELAQSSLKPLKILNR